MLETTGGATVNPAATPQPPPRPGQHTVIYLARALASQMDYDVILDDLFARAEQGKAKYGTYLMTHNGRDALMDLYQELLDAAMYAVQLSIEQQPSIEASRWARLAMTMAKDVKEMLERRA